MFTHFFIDRPIFAGVISILILIAGSLAFFVLPIEQTPDITPPTVMVSTTYPGASADVVAQTVAIPIEQEVNGVEDMICMSSKATDDGTYELVVTFEVGTDIDMATVLVQNRVAIATPKLPEEVKREGVKTEKQSTSIVLMVNIVSPNSRYTEIDMSNFVATKVKDELARIPGVGKVNVMGAKDLGMRVWLDPRRLKARQVTTNDVVNAIREQNVQVAAGQIGAPPSPSDVNFQYTINTLGRLQDAEQFRNMILKTTADGRVLRVKDVAEVEEGAQNYRWEVQLTHYDDDYEPGVSPPPKPSPSVAVAIYQLPGSNSLELANSVRAKMLDIQDLMPPGMEYTIAYDTTKFVKASIDEVYETLFIAILLVVFTVYIFLQDWRATLVPAVTIPVALIGTLAVMQLLGFSINTLTLFGLVLAIGIVVDDAIVVVENTSRLIDEEGLSSKEATKKAMIQVAGPVIATTMVLLAVFVPTAFMGGITGRLYNQFSITIAVSTVFSSLNALTLSPALCSILLRPSKKEEDKIIFFRWYNIMFDKVTSGYMGVVKFLVRRTAIVTLMFIGFIVLTAYGFVKVPGGFLPDEDQGYFLVNAELPDGATLNRTREVMTQIDAMLAETPGVADVISVNGYSALDTLITPNACTYFVVMDDWDQRSTPELHIAEVSRSVQAKLSTIQEGFAIAFLPPPITGLGNAGGFDFRLRDVGDAGSAQLQDFAEDLVAAGQSMNTATRLNNNFSASVPQLFLEVNREKAKRLAIPLEEVFGTLQAYLGSAYVNDFNKYDRTWKVQIQADAKFRNRVEDIYQLEVRSLTGKMIPLRTLVTVKDMAGPKVVYRYNTAPSAAITGQPRVGFSSGQAMNELEQLSNKVLPQSIRYEWSSISFQEKQAGNQAPFIFGMSVVFVYLFLCALYESWSVPWGVIFSVPFALLGGIASTAARNFDNNVYTQIGIVLLIGLATKTAILIIEFAKQERESGLSVIEAATKAAHLRFRAILMTAFSFILGVIPLVIASGAGAASRQCLGTAVCGGMTAATVFGVFFIPSLYVAIQASMEKLFGPPKCLAETSTPSPDSVATQVDNGNGAEEPEAK